MQFMIDDNGIKGTFSELKDIQRDMKSTKNQVSYIRNTLAIQGSTRESLKQNLEDLGTNLEELIQKLARMENGLELVVSIYRECENRILGDDRSSNAVIASADVAEGAIIQEIRDWFDDLLNEFKDWLNRQEEKARQKREEKRVDRAMTDEISALLDSDRYSYETWASASVSEREQILRELFNELNEIYGINVADFYIKPIQAAPGYITYGYLSRRSDGYMSVTLNGDLLADADNYNQILNTMIHEMRHGYQHSVVNNPDQYQVSDKTVESWRNNFNDYKTIDEDGYNAYRDQPVERDARGFADGVIK